MGSFAWFSCLLPENMVIKLSKTVSFLQFFADVSKKSKTATAIYVYASESSPFTLLETSIGYYAMT